MFRKNLITVWFGIMVLSGMFLMGQESWPPVDPCAEINCGAHGTCKEGVCDCDAGYQGELCDALIQEVEFSIHPDQIEHRTGRIIGWNLGQGAYYTSESDSLNRQWRTPERVAAVQALGEIRAANGDCPLMRFSGLQIDGPFGGDGYHFWDYVAPDTPPEEKSDKFMAVFEYMSIMEETDSEPIIMLNFGSGTAREAADYVTYLNGSELSDPLVAARQFWGQYEPYGVDILEIGNEVYGFWNTGFFWFGSYSYANPWAPHGGDPGWYFLPSSDPHNFARRALAYMDEIESPNVRYWVPFNQSSMDFWGGLESAVGGLSPLLQNPAVESVVVHQYLLDDLLFSDGLSVCGNLELMMAAPAYFELELREAREILNTIERDVPIGLVITEYGPADGFCGAFGFPYGDTLALGISLADMMVTYLRLGIEAAAQHIQLTFENESIGDNQQLVEPWYNPFRLNDDGTIRKMPQYWVTRIVADHLLDHIVHTDVHGDAEGQIDIGGIELHYPLINMVAMVDERGEHLALLFVNRSLDYEYPVAATLSNHIPEVVEGTLFTSEEALDDASIMDLEPQPLDFTTIGSQIYFYLLPHSISGLLIDIS